MRSLGLSEDDLTSCDMSVCGADSTDIKVLGAVLVEFKCKDSPLTSKQVMYICEGVAGALLSLNACIDLGLVPENFPKPGHNSACQSVNQQSSQNCECKCPLRTKPPDPPFELPFKPIPTNITQHENWIREKYVVQVKFPH